METISQKLARIRKDAGLSQKELARLVGRSSSYISRIESGEREHTPSILKDWLTVCKIKIGWNEKEYQTQLKELHQSQAVQKSSSKHPNLAEDLFSENYVYNSNEFKKAFESAHELSVIGMGQSRMIISCSGEIQRILKKGGRVKFVLCNPECAAIEMIIKIGLSGQRNKKLVAQEHWSIIDRLISLSKDKDCKGALEIKLINLLPAFTLYGFDLYHPEKAKLFIWITAFKESSDKRPGFQLSIHDKYWFSFFGKQFEHFWNWEEATTIKISDENYKLAFER